MGRWRLFHRSTRAITVPQERDTQKNNHLRGRIPGGGKRPFFAHCPFPRGRPRKRKQHTKNKIRAYLEGSCLGKANRASGTELERTLHISGTCLRKQVNRLRCKEHPIASDRSGYFYATNAGEVYDTIRQLKQMVSGLEGGHQRSGTVYGTFPGARGGRTWLSRPFRGSAARRRSHRTSCSFPARPS